MPATFNFDTSHVQWTHFDGDGFDYPIDYSIAVLRAEPATGNVDLLLKWAPNAYCHYHRHVADTTILVLEGEQHVIETSEAGEEIHKIRTAGEYAHNPGGDVHMERGGPEGAVVFFGMQAHPDGRVFEVLDKDQNVLITSTIEEFAAQLASV